jgi:hypothetical protein
MRNGAGRKCALLFSLDEFATLRNLKGRNA